MMIHNTTEVTDFSYCFASCFSLQSIPEDLFANNPDTPHFYGCFSGCSSLQTVPENLFANNYDVTSFRECFNTCNALKIFTIKIGSKSVTSCTNFAPIVTDSNITIKVPSGSTTQNTFTTWKGSNTNVKIVPY